MKADSVSLLDRRRAIAALVVVNALWGMSFPLMKCLNLQIDQHFGVTEQSASTALRAASAAWMIAIRFGCSLILVCIFLRRIVKRVQMAHFLSGAAIGGVFFLGIMLQVIGLATIPASRSGFLTSLSVVFTPLIATLLRRQIPRAPIVIAAFVALAGVAVLTGALVAENGTIRLAADVAHHWSFGDAMTALGAVVFSFQILLIDAFGKRYDAEAFTPSMFATTAILAALFFAFSYSHVPETAHETSHMMESWFSFACRPAFMLMIALLCVFPSLIAFAWMNKYQPAISAGQAAVIYTLEPLFASLFAMILPATLSIVCGVMYASEQFSVPLVIGGAMVLLANVLSLWPSKSHRDDEGLKTT